MREILFKAKRSNWEGLPKEEWWVKGYLMDENYINVPFNDYDVGGRFDEPIEIYTETVCEYTGLTDKNGRKIFEGDIVKALSVQTARTIIATVKFSKDDFWYGFIPSNSGKNYSLCELLETELGDEIEIEIIGNIFDNPELLRSTEEAAE